MSGPISTADAPGADEHEAHVVTPPTLERTSSRATEVGGMAVSRALPKRARRTIGAWCFVDHFQPSDPEVGGGMQVGAHPHIGLQTVTWLVSGEVDHHDDLGVDQRIRPGQLNLMTAGHGVAHAEQSPADATEPVHGAQLWLALPEGARHGAADFEHHSELPQGRCGDLHATVLVGGLGSLTAPAKVHSPLVGVAIAPVDPGMSDAEGTLSLERSFEHGLVVLRGAVAIGDDVIEPGELVYLGQGREELTLRPSAESHMLLLGGEPFEEEPLMWWNFVGRTRAEIEAARTDWQSAAERFGPVASSLERMDAPPLPWAAERNE